jgi:hypothetical protein
LLLFGEGNHETTALKGLTFSKPLIVFLNIIIEGFDGGLDGFA